MVPAKDFQIAIALWENDIQIYEASSSEKISVTHGKFNLEEMCPEPLRKHLLLIGAEKLATYELMRAEIADWLADEFRRPVKQRAAALEQSGGDCDDTE